MPETNAPRHHRNYRYTFDGKQYPMLQHLTLPQAGFLALTYGGVVYEGSRLVVVVQTPRETSGKFAR